MHILSAKTCPKCGFHQMKTWHDLSDDEKMLIEKLPLNAELSSKQRENNSFCPRCWFEEVSENTETIV